MSVLYRRSLYAAGCAMASALIMAAPASASPAPPYEVLVARLDRLPATREANARYEAAEALARQAQALPNPSITLEAENAYGSGPYSGYDSAESHLVISQPLELWGKRGARIEAARAAANTAARHRDQDRWLAAGRLARAYAEAEAAERHYLLAEEALSLTQADANAARALVDEGREPRLRALQADSEVAATRARLGEARAGRDIALARLTALALLDEPATSVPASLLDRIPAATTTPGDHPMVQVARAELDTASRLVTVERRRALPDVTASFGVTRFEDSRDEAMTFGVSLSLPLFDRNTHGIHAAQAEQRAAEARLDASRLESIAAHRAARVTLEAARSRTGATDDGVVAAEEAYRLARIGFDAGRISQLELRSVRTALIHARNTAIEARLARVSAEIDLARLEGRAPFGDAP